MVKIAISLLLIAGLLVIAGLYEYQRFVNTPMSISEDGYVYTVKPGTNLQKISKEFTALGLTDFPAEYFHLYGRLENKAHKIKAGEYLIPSGTTLPQVLDLFIDGEVLQYSFTIVEGMTSQQLIDNLVSDERIVVTLKNTQLDHVMKIISESSSHGEGEFLPETYHFTAGTTDVDLLKRAHKQMTMVLEEKWKNKAENLPYKTPYEALIMASIIEKESGIAEERPQIAGVFVRRLKIGMRLQTDPTVIYGMGDSYKGNIRRKDLRTDTPYNTYTRHGLPPTPIALPSKEAIEAALHPQEGKSLYFVATGKEGRHVFSNSLNAHNAAVRKYQLKK